MVDDAEEHHPHGDQCRQPDFDPFAYFFVELTSLDDLSFAASSSKRVKFTCACASAHQLVLGTSSGTGYAFSRYKPKSRPGNAVSMPPVDVFVTKDGSVNTMNVSPSEHLVAVGSDSGRVSVAATATDGQPTAIVYSVAGDARKPDKVTSIVWTPDSKSIYVGHSSGSVYIHRLTSRFVFRSSNELLCTLDGPVVQMDLSGSRLLISTTAASHILIIDPTSSTPPKQAPIQIGKKARNSRMGACFLGSSLPSEMGGASSEVDVASTSTDCQFIVAARPNGRMWEANTSGVVYRTHQFRQSNDIPRYSAISFRTAFKGLQTTDDTDELQTAVNMDVNMQTLHRITVDKTTFVLSWYGSHLLLFDVESSRVVLISDLEEEIADVSVCGSDVFVLFTGNAFLRKYTIFNRITTMEKLRLRGCHSQSAQLILHTCSRVQWRDDVIQGCMDSLATGGTKKKREAERLRSALSDILDKRKGGMDKDNSQQNSVYDNCLSPSTSASSPLAVATSLRLPSGVHRVVPVRPSDASGCDDDFNFRLPTPLRQKSSSTPAVDGSLSISSAAMTSLSKQASVPLTSFEVDVCSRNGTPDVTTDDILMRARNLLETDGHIVGADSLRTLLQLESPVSDVMFVNTITVSNAARALADLVISAPPPVVDMTSVLKVDRRAKRPTIVKPVKRPPNSKVVRSSKTAGNESRIPGVTVSSVKAPKSPSSGLRSPVSRVEVVTSLRSPTLIKQPSNAKVLEANSNILPSEQNKTTAKAANLPPWSDVENNGSLEILESEWLESRLGRLVATGAAGKPDDQPPSIESPLLSGSPSPSTATDSGVLESMPVEPTETAGHAHGKARKARGEHHCADCGLHRTWIGLSLLSSVCRKVIVHEDLFTIGGVPSRPSEWAEILVRRARMTSCSSNHPLGEAKTTLCPRCEMGIASAGRVLASLPTSAGLVPDGNRISGEKIRERLAESSDDRLKTVLFGRDIRQNGETPTTIQPSSSNGHSHDTTPIAEPHLSITIARPSSKSSNHETEQIEAATESDDDIFSWLADVDLKLLMFLCCLSIGYRELMSLIRQTPPTLLHSLSDEQWATLVALSIRDVSMKKNPVGNRLISDVLSSVGLSSFLSAEPSQPSRTAGVSSMTSSPSSSLARRQSPPAIYSWIIDTNKACPFCTLQLQTAIAGKDLGVTSFSCGHSYHTPCLAARSFCIACRVHARKQAQLKNNREKM